MASERDLDVVFFDIGGTLGERNAATGEFTPFASSSTLLKTMRDTLGLRVGIITSLGTLTNPDGLALLKKAKLAQFLDPKGFVSEHDAGVAKPDPKIYVFAAKKVGVPVNRCLFVGENLIEVIGALSAGMKAVQKPRSQEPDLPS